MVGACYRPSNQDEEAGEIFYKHLGEVLLSLAVFLEGGGLQLTRCQLKIQYNREETVQA